jgi:hypothetical protein
MEKFSMIQSWLPLTKATLDRNAETQSQYLERKISWAVREMAIAKIPISVNLLRRKVGMLRRYCEPSRSSYNRLQTNVAQM